MQISSLKVLTPDPRGSVAFSAPRIGNDDAVETDLPRRKKISDKHRKHRNICYSGDMKTHADGHEQPSLWLDVCHPPARMCEQIAALGEEWLPRARQTLADEEAR